MGSQTRKKSPKGVFRQFRKQLREKSKDNKRINKQNRRIILDTTKITVEREISEATLKRLHTLGIQKFGSSPFSDHFDRWLANVTTVLSEFEAYPNMDIDDQFAIERSQTLAVIRLQLEEKSRQEASVELLMKNLAFFRNNLTKINVEYKTAVSKNKGQRNSEIKHLHNVINLLKKEQNKIVQTKTGFFRGISKRDREQREIAIVEELNDKQTELELMILNFNEHQKSLQDEYERKKEPILEQIRNLKKKIRVLETDVSLEDRWFACEALIDTINNFLQRKAAKTF
jgi:hypothetical protein